MPSSPEPFSSPLRMRLLSLAGHLTDRPLTTVVAPAGSGKTTLLTHWRKSLPDGVRAVWLDTLAIHGDAAGWVGDLLDALDASGLRFGRETRRTLSNLAGGDEDWRILHRALLRDWLTVEGETVLFLDNFHAIEGGCPTEQLVSELLRSPPLNLHFVVASRGTLPGAAVRLAAGDRAHEVGVDDLNLRFEEAAELLRARGLEPEPELVTTLLGRTEGWATGLQLAARALSRVPSEERQAYAERIGRERDLFAYVASEVLAGESEAQKRLLESAAVLGRAEPEALCELLDDLDARPLIDHALDHGLLLGDGREVWPHQLWQELLRDRLRERLDADAWRAIHGRAARLLAERGRVEESLEAYRESQDWESIAYLLHGVGHEWLERGRFRYIQRWLEELPAELREFEPRLLEMQGMLLTQLDSEEASRLLERAARIHRKRGDGASESAALGALTYHQLTHFDLAGARRTMQRGFRLRRLVADPRARADVYVALAGFSALRRRFGRAIRISERALRKPLSPLSKWFNLLLLGLLYVLAGEPERARRLLDGALEDPAISRRAFAYYSLLLLRSHALARLGDLAAARRDFDAARTGFDDFQLLRFKPAASLVGADLYGLLGDREACEREFEDTVRFATKHGAVALEGLARGQMALRWLQWGERERALAEARRSVDVHERGLADGAIAFPWWLVLSLWVLGRLDDPEQAWQRLLPHRRELGGSGLAMTGVLIQLAAADLAERAGRSDEARTLAREAWQLAERAHVELDPFVGSSVAPFAAEEAIRQGVAEDLAFETLRRLRPDAVPDVLSRLARDGNARVRERAVERMGQFGGRALHGPLERATRDRSARVRAVAERLLPDLDLRPEHPLRISSLGGLRAFRGETPVADAEWRGNMAQRLLYRLLCAEGRPVPRDVLLADLWPDAAEAAGRNNLRVALSRLSDALDPDRLPGSSAWFLRTGPAGIALDLARVQAWDVARFREWAGRAESLRRDGRAEEALSAYQEAVACHGGPFLPEAAYEEWALPLRRRLEDELRSIGARYGTLLLDGALHDRAIRLAERLLEADSGDEAAWLLRMRAQLLQGDRSAAFRTYQQACEALRAALDAEPGEALRDLAARARAAG